MLVRLRSFPNISLIIGDPTCPCPVGSSPLSLSSRPPEEKGEPLKKQGGRKSERERESRARSDRAREAAHRQFSVECVVERKREGAAFGRAESTESRKVKRYTSTPRNRTCVKGSAVRGIKLREDLGQTREEVLSSDSGAALTQST